MAEAVLGTHDDWQIGKTKIFLKVRAACSGCHGSAMSRGLHARDVSEGATGYLDVCVCALEITHGARH